MLRQLFILLFMLISDPVGAWNQLKEKQEKNNEDFYKSYLYPVLGVIALLSFVGVLISIEKFDVQIALKIVIKQIAVYFGSFYLSSLVLSEWLMPRFGEMRDKYLCERFVGYSSALIYAVTMLQSLFPGSLVFLYLILCYSVYMIWEGVVRYLEIGEEHWVKFTVLSSAIILLFPFLIQLLIGWLIPGMKI
jgi:hypothetical protein